MDRQSIIETYQRDGVARCKALLSDNEVRRWRERIVQLIADRLGDMASTDYVLEPDGKTVRNLFRIEQYDATFNELATRPDILELVRELVHGEPVLVGVETFNKPARVGSGVPWHQDNAYFCQSPPDMLTVWIALDAVTPENGPVFYVPGSHRAMQPHRPSGVKGNSIGLADPPTTPRAELFHGTLEPGDALLHHCQVVHQSDPNHTDHPRCALLLVYRGAHTQTDPRRKAEYEAALALTRPPESGANS